MDLSQLKPLNADQYDRAKAAAVERVRRAAGERPTRDALRREYGPLVSVLDVLALVIFSAALFVSSAHIITHAGATAAASYQSLEQDAGIIIAPGVWAIIHQVGYILLAEAAMLLFFVMFASEPQRARNWRRWVFLLLALTAAVFVVAANLASGTHLLESLMPPVFTLGIGFRLEAIIIEQLRRRQELDERYSQRIREWEAAEQDPETHPDYGQYFMRAIWDQLMKLSSNREFVDAPSRLKLAAVQREMLRDKWTETPYDGDMAPSSNGHRPASELEYTVPLAEGGGELS